MKILVTGGVGYIGSHTVLELQEHGHEVVVVDNLSNSKREVLSRVEELSGKEITFYQVDLRDEMALEQVFLQHQFDCCIHFAGFKAVGESVLLPWEYYDNNINGTLVLIKLLRKYHCKNLIFSSSASVYGNVKKVPITEDTPMGECTNPYGRTKAMIEQMLQDIYKADNEWNIVILRYFNPIGAHKSGLIGENPNGIPNNLMPYITQVAAGKLKELHIYGDDYDTPDGTGVREYIHVVDLASGHVCVLQAIEQHCGIEIFNLGTGKGYSVLEIVHAFEDVNNIKIPYIIDERRPGDVATSYSDSTKIENLYGWRSQNGIEEMCRDSWRWESNYI